MGRFKIKIKMNENAFDTLKYMCIHLFIFLFKNVFIKWLSKYSNKSIEKAKHQELDILKQKRDKLKEDIREISSTSDYVKYAKMERQIDNLNDEIKKRESNNLINDNVKSNMNIIQRIFNSILNSFIFKIMMFSSYPIEYYILKNKYFEINYEENKNNIIVNYYYDENKNNEYSLIPIFTILIFESIVLDSIPFFK